MNPREFVCIGESIPEVVKIEHKEFLFNVQKAMLLSLVERKMLTKNQAEQVLYMLTTSSQVTSSLSGIFVL